ncbi:hypothetical protein FHX80_111849 [Streptomyces brevispora]|uniref:DUF7848 domain-containing protein n=1 Tax=Streptomyces brevispora TaxID=887462 RepID=A0A561UVN1_9ACTN|nr:hypothetical protein FHX80_111849 [Streptomyces brevispora]
MFVEDTSGSPAIHETECTTCGEGPEPSVPDDVAVRHLWCAEHPARTGHTGFLALRVGLLRAVPVDEVRRPGAGGRLHGSAQPSAAPRPKR